MALLCKNKGRISDDIPPEMKILNPVIPQSIVGSCENCSCSVTYFSSFYCSLVLYPELFDDLFFHINYFTYLMVAFSTGEYVLSTPDT